MNRRVLIALAAAGCLASPAVAVAQSRPAAEAAPRAVRTSEVFPYLERYYGIPAAERTAFRLAYRLQVNDRPFTGRGWYLDAQNGRTPIAFAPDGTVRNLPTAAMLRDRNHRFQLDVPSGSRFSMGLELQPTAAPAQEMPAAQITQSITQANAGIRRAAGLLRVAVPTMGRATFPGARTGEAVTADRRATPLPLVNGAPAFTPAEMPQARTLRFAQTPSRILIGPAARARRR